MKPRLIICEFHHLGDSILCFPFIRASLEKYEVWVFCRPSQKEVFAMLIPAERILLWEPFWTRGKVWCQREIREQGKRIKDLRAEAVVCGWADSRVEVLMFLSGARDRVGFPMNRRNYFSCHAAGIKSRLGEGQILAFIARLFFRKKLLTFPLQRQEHEQAHWKDWVQVGEALGFEVSMKRPWVAVDSPKTAKSEENATRWLLHLGSRIKENRWSAEGFAEVVQKYLEPEQQEDLCGSPRGD
jgi:ADP-heptose:LPS heptosyltransferase